MLFISQTRSIQMDAMTISQEGQSSANPNCLSHIENMVISVHRVHPRVSSGDPPKFWNNQMVKKLLKQA